ncbi:MAG: hypothetical protein AB9897_03750 [Anaerolineaceae bacterium]
MKKKQFIGFLLAIALGLSAALIYGWMIAPAQPANTSLASLRSDYKTDYVLMVAEAYPQVADTPFAIEMLRHLNQSDPLKAVDEALVSAQQFGYSQSDMRLLADLDIRVRQIGGGQ